MQMEDIKSRFGLKMVAQIVPYDHRVALFFFGARIWLGTILSRFSINYFSGLGLRIRVRVWVMVRVTVWVRVSAGVRVRVSVVIWSG